MIHQIQSTDLSSVVDEQLDSVVEIGRLNLVGHDRVPFRLSKHFEKKPIWPALSSDRRFLPVAFRSQAHRKPQAGISNQKYRKKVTPPQVEFWLASKLDAGMAARTRNSYLQALKGFCQWCVRNQRLTTNLLRNVAKDDEKSDRRLMRRALPEQELKRLLYVARLRPLPELARETIKKQQTRSLENV